MLTARENERTTHPRKIRSNLPYVLPFFMCARYKLQVKIEKINIYDLKYEMPWFKQPEDSFGSDPRGVRNKGEVDE